VVLRLNALELGEDAFPNPRDLLGDLRFDRGHVGLARARLHPADERRRFAVEHRSEDLGEIEVPLLVLEDRAGPPAFACPRVLRMELRRRLDPADLDLAAPPGPDL